MRIEEDDDVAVGVVSDGEAALVVEAAIPNAGFAYAAVAAALEIVAQSRFFSNLTFRLLEQAKSHSSEGQLGFRPRVQ